VSSTIGTSDPAAFQLCGFIFPLFHLRYIFSSRISFFLWHHVIPLSATVALQPWLMPEQSWSSWRQRWGTRTVQNWVWGQESLFGGIVTARWFNWLFSFLLLQVDSDHIISRSCSFQINWNSFSAARVAVWKVVHKNTKLWKLFSNEREMLSAIWDSPPIEITTYTVRWRSRPE